MKKEDQRIVRTKEKLANSLIHLMKTQKMNDIKVSELCEEANVSRATFYNNFDSIQAVFYYFITSFELPMEEDIRKNINTQSDQVNNVSEVFKAYIFPLVASLEKKREELKEVISMQRDSGDFYIAVLELVQNLCSRLLVSYSSIVDVGVPDDVAIAYSSGSIASLILHLLMVGDKYTLEEKQHFVYHLVFEMDNYYYEHHKTEAGVR